MPPRKRGRPLGSTDKKTPPPGVRARRSERTAQSAKPERNSPGEQAAGRFYVKPAANTPLRFQQDNPKQPGSKSYARYNGYKSSTSYSEMVRLGGTLGDFRHDLEAGFLIIASRDPPDIPQCSNDDERVQRLLTISDFGSDAPVPASHRPVPPGANEFIVSELRGRGGESHGVSHALSVRDLSLYIWETVSSEGELGAMLAQSHIDGATVVELAAMLHDVCDHKYVDVSRPSGAAALQRMAEFLSSHTASRVEADAVHTIIANVSYSKEKSGKYDPERSLEEPLRTLRDIVSDADKLEAIGATGLHRCIEYSRENDAQLPPLQLITDVAQHCDEKLLLLVPNYIRTEPGRRLGLPRHQLIKRWRAQVHTDLGV